MAAKDTVSVTNHTSGPRGVNLKGGVTKWVEPGQTVEITKADVVGDLPDFGKPADEKDTSQEDALIAARGEIETLQEQVKTQAARIAELEKAAKGD